jgi:threonine dehydratase
MIGIEDVRAAAVRLKGHARVTPLLNSAFLDEVAGRRVFVKAEALQHTGSFKFRGAWSALSKLDAEARAAGILAFSSGNHAQGVALSARMHGVPCIIIMPADAPQVKIENTRAMGAEVVLYDRATEDRDAIGARLQAERGMVLVKPFDDPMVIAGQGTAGLEIAAQVREAGAEPDQVLVCCGGGGLTSGIALALEADLPGARVHPVEPEEFDDTARSLAAGTRQVNARTSGSLCDAILTPSPGEITFPIMQRLCGAGLAVSDDDCLRAMALAWDRLKIVLEPGGAVALAAALFHAQGTQDIVAVASGGNVDRAVFAMALDRFA